MSMAYSDHENCSVLLNPIDNKMGFEGMNSDRRRNLFSLTSHSRVGSDQIKHSEQVIVVTPSLGGSEHAYTLFGDPNDVLFRFN